MLLLLLVVALVVMVSVSLPIASHHPSTNYGKPTRLPLVVVCRSPFLAVSLCLSRSLALSLSFCLRVSFPLLLAQ